jgi:hypothetical protein
MPPDHTMVAIRTEKSTNFPRLMVVIDGEALSLFFWRLATQEAGPALSF